MIEKLRSLDSEEMILFLTGLFKPFHCLPHDSLVAKLRAYVVKEEY